MFDPLQWLDDCEVALSDADRLAAWLAETRGPGIAAELHAVRVRIAVLRAELGKARAELRAADGSAPLRRWAEGSPWPVTGRS